MYGIDVKQFKERVVAPVLNQIGLNEPARVSLVLGTCLHESHLIYLVQLPNGPALGVGQMEPATHSDLWDNYLRYQLPLAGKIRSLLPDYFAQGINPPVDYLIGNLNYAVAMIAVHYRRVKAALPDNSPTSLAQYWKAFYNTYQGKGTIEQALQHFEAAVSA